jgi:hypothetical protein
VPWRSKHPLLTGHTGSVTLVEIRCSELPVVKASMKMTACESDHQRMDTGMINSVIDKISIVI